MGIATLLALALQDGWERDAGAVCAEYRDHARRMEELLEDISILNLLNGLYLTADQVAGVRALAREADAARSRYCEKRDEAQREFAGPLEAWRERLARGQEADDELREAVWRGEEAVEETERELRQALAELDRRLDDALTLAQREVVERFEPCIFPPRELADPVRAGQPSSLTEDQEHRLAELRRLPDDVYARVVEGRVCDFACSFEDYLIRGMPAHERDRELARLCGIVERARALGDVEFALQRGALAQEALATQRDFTARAHEIEAVWRTHEGLSRRGRWLLNPRVIPLLEAVAIRPAPMLPTGARPTAPSCSVCAGGAEPEESPEEHERSFAHRVAEAGLSPEQAAEVRRIAAEAQREFWNVLFVPRDDGRNMALDWLRQETGECDEDLWECPSAAGEFTYGDHWEMLNDRAARRIRRVVGDVAADRFLEHGAPMELDVGRP